MNESEIIKQLKYCIENCEADNGAIFIGDKLKQKILHYEKIYNHKR